MHFVHFYSKQVNAHKDQATCLIPWLGTLRSRNKSISRALFFSMAFWHKEIHLSVKAFFLKYAGLEREVYKQQGNKS